MRCEIKPTVVVSSAWTRTLKFPGKGSRSRMFWIGVGFYLLFFVQLVGTSVGGTETGLDIRGIGTRLHAASGGLLARGQSWI